MGALLAGGLGGVASLVGDLFGASSARGQQKFEERMADTTYQRTVADMKKAGLNPMMMMARGGGPDPQPGGTGVAQGKFYSDAASKAANLALTEAQINAQNANAQQTRAQTVGLLPEQITQLQQMIRNLRLEGQTILPDLEARQNLQWQQAQLAEAQRARLFQLLPFDVKAAELQPGLVSAQTKAASESAARTGLGEVGRLIGPDLIRSFFKYWDGFFDEVQRNSAKSGASQP